MNTQPQTKRRVSNPTNQLLFVAARIPVLARYMGLDLSDDGKVLSFTPRERPWLVPHPTRPEELTFDPDVFARPLGKVSSGELHCMLFLLNVWNPSYARSKEWQFDLFRAMSCLDTENSNGIADWLQNPQWP